MQNEKQETTTDITFRKLICNESRTVRTQEIEKNNPSWDMVEDCLWNMFEDDNEFVVLTVSNACDNIRYVQAAQFTHGIIVQLGIEEGNDTRLVEKPCTENQCRDIFHEFYQSSHVQNVEEYQPELSHRGLLPRQRSL